MLRDLFEEGQATRQPRDLFAEQSQPAQPKTSIMQDIGQGIGNIAAGAVRGAGSIGATISAPYDIASDALSGKGLSLASNMERRRKIDEGLQQTFGADPESLLYQGGKLAGEIAGTAGAGGALAQGVRRVAPLVPRVAPLVLEMAAALESGGFAKGVSLPKNIAGGAISGGAMSGMVNPADTPTGMVIGGALPAGVAAVTRGIPAVAKNIVGLRSGVGNAPLETAFEAGKTGGREAELFKRNFSGNAQINEALSIADQNLENMRRARSEQYKATIGKSMTDKPLDFAPIENALDDALNTVKIKGAPSQNLVTPETSIYVDKFGQRVEVPEYLKPPKLDSILEDVRKNGGLNISLAGEFNMSPKEAVRRYPGLFTKNGKGLDEVSRHVEQKGWVGEHTLADADYRATGGREGYVKDMIDSALADKTSVIHPSQESEWYKHLAHEKSLQEQGINKVSIPAKYETTSGEHWTVGKDEQGKIAEVASIVNEWKSSPDLHTVEGLDALKRRIGAVYPDNPKMAQSQRVIDTMYNAVKGAIEKQAHDYANTMRDYSNMTDQIRDIQKSLLGQGRNASTDTAMRKLQSLMRNNVQTNYGARQQSADTLRQYGQDFMPALAGQSLNEWMPRGISRASTVPSAALEYGLGGPVLAGLGLGSSSPKIVGGIAYGSGVATRKLNALADLMAQRNLLPSSSVAQSAIINSARR